jgi:hypothetical protein
MENLMSKKFAGKFDAFGRVGVRERDTGELLRVYPNTVSGPDKEIENCVLQWFAQSNSKAKHPAEDYYVDTLTPMELIHAQEKFTD